MGIGVVDAGEHAVLDRDDPAGLCLELARGRHDLPYAVPMVGGDELLAGGIIRGVQ